MFSAGRGSRSGRGLPFLFFHQLPAGAGAHTASWLTSSSSFDVLEAQPIAVWVAECACDPLDQPLVEWDCVARGWGPNGSSARDFIAATALTGLAVPFGLTGVATLEACIGLFRPWKTTTSSLEFDGVGDESRLAGRFPLAFGMLARLGSPFVSTTKSAAACMAVLACMLPSPTPINSTSELELSLPGSSISAELWMCMCAIAFSEMSISDSMAIFVCIAVSSNSSTSSRSSSSTSLSSAATKTAASSVGLG